MNKLDKDEYERGIADLPSHIREILNEKLSLNEIEILHTYTIQQREEHVNQTRLDLQKELDGLVERIADAGFDLKNLIIVPQAAIDHEDDDDNDNDKQEAIGKKYSKPSNKRLMNASEHPSNIFAVNWLAENHEKYHLGARNTGRSDYERAVKSNSSPNVKEVSPANYRCMLAVLKYPKTDIELLCKEYRAGSPAAIWAVPLILQAKSNLA